MTVTRQSIIGATLANNDLIVQELLDSKADPNEQTLTNGRTALHIAARNDNERILNLLINAKASLNQKDLKEGKTALHFAAEKGHQNIFELLIAAKADPGITDESGHKPFYKTAKKTDPFRVIHRLFSEEEKTPTDQKKVVKEKFEKIDPEEFTDLNRM
jgi:ankyrin repeat protein